MNNVTLLGIDLAKDVFQLHGVNEHGKKCPFCGRAEVKELKKIKKSLTHI